MSRTTLLPQHVADHLRSVKPMIYALYVLLIFDLFNPGRPAKIGELAAITGVDARTLEKQLNALCASDRAICNSQGYVLTAAGRALILGSNLNNEIQEEAPALALDQAPQALPPSTNCADQDPEDPSTQCVLLEEEESIFPIPESESSSSIPSTQSARPQPTTAQILDATELLFGKSMSTSGITDRSRRLAIGWVAQAWDQRSYLRSPQGLIYQRLKSESMPQQKYFDHPRSFLPHEYLARLGLAELVIATDPALEKAAEIEPAIERAPAEAVEPAASAADPDVDLAWKAVLNHLRSEMAKVSFDTWVKDARPLRIRDGMLEILVNNTYARDWLESRLTSTINRLLIGILAAEVKVVFVVATETE